MACGHIPRPFFQGSLSSRHQGQRSMTRPLHRICPSILGKVVLHSWHSKKSKGPCLPSHAYERICRKFPFVKVTALAVVAHQRASLKARIPSVSAPLSTEMHRTAPFPTPTTCARWSSPWGMRHTITERAGEQTGMSSASRQSVFSIMSATRNSTRFFRRAPPYASFCLVPRVSTRTSLVPIRIVRQVAVSC
jgi:hypothetical protein